MIVNTHGRHDPCVGIRATPIAEAMLALVLMDHALRHRAQNADVVTATPKIARARAMRRPTRSSPGDAVDDPDPTKREARSLIIRARVILAPAPPRANVSATSSPICTVAASSTIAPSALVTMA